MSGYAGWLQKEEYRELRQVERELYPSVREMEQERSRTSLRPRRKAEPIASTRKGSAIGSDRRSIA